MKKEIQDKIDAIKKMARNSPLGMSKEGNRNAINVNDSLVKTIRNKKDAAIFMAELEAAIKMAQEQ